LTKLAKIVARSGHAKHMTQATWKPDAIDKAGRDLPESAYAFPNKRKEPLTDASHVRNAVARFDQVQDVTDSEREQAFANIQKAAQHYQVDMSAQRWQDLGKRS